MLNGVTMFLRFFKMIGVDKAIAYVLLSKGWNIVSGVIILLLISKYLTMEEQGYYFTFSSILALQILFELGFGTVVIQFISHETPNLMFSKTSNGLTVTGDEVSLSRFHAIIKLVLKWYAVVAFLITIVVFPVGLFFFAGYGFTLETILGSNGPQWFWPWVTLILSAVLCLSVTPVLSIAEGCGYIPDVAKVRFFQSMVNAVLALGLLVTGHGLYAVSASLLSLFIVGTVWCSRNFHSIIVQSIKDRASKQYFSWRREMLPVQWRIAVSWLSGFFIYQLFNPIAFKVYGAEFAGKLGMTINICNMLLNLSLSWIMTKAPRFGNMIAEKNRENLVVLYKKTFYQSLVFLCIFILSASVFLFLSKSLNMFFIDRLL